MIRTDLFPLIRLAIEAAPGGRLRRVDMAAMAGMIAGDDVAAAARQVLNFAELEETLDALVTAGTITYDAGDGGTWSLTS